jgi:photosystem II stability/assembly factor-like uncharacterized protein
MTLCIGANDGVYRAPRPDADPERVLDAGTTLSVRRLAGETYAACDSGLFRSLDGESWTGCGISESAVTAVAVSPDGRRLYAGTRPAHLYVSTDGGETWERSEPFASYPGREHWENLGGVGPQLRALAVHPDAPDRVVAGVEAAGVYVSPDAGTTWERRSDGLNADVHDLTALGRDDWVAACGRGCYRTTDAGRTWRALDTSTDQFWHTYHRESLLHKGTLYTGAEDRAARRFTDEATGLLLASPGAGRTWRTEDYPKSDNSFPLAWAVHEGTLLAGTSDGHVLADESGGWRERTSVPTTVRSLAVW